MIGISYQMPYHTALSTERNNNTKIGTIGSNEKKQLNTLIIISVEVLC
jgi:hypothetical protein